MRKVVITGIGIVSCIGNNKTEVLESLLNTKSGIVFSEEHKKYNFRSQVVGTIKNLDIDKHIDRYIEERKHHCLVRRIMFGSLDGVFIDLFGPLELFVH